MKSTSARAEFGPSVGLIGPNSSEGQLVPALIGAGNEIERGREIFPVVIVVTTDRGGGRLLEQQIARLRRQIAGHAATVHYVLLSSEESITPMARANEVRPRAPQPGAAGAPVNGGRPGARATAPTQSTTLPQEPAFVQGAMQVDIGISLTSLTGGRFERIAAGTRLATLVPEIGTQIASSHARQRDDLRVTYEVPGNAALPQRLSARVVLDDVSVRLSLDGHLP